MDGSRSYHRQQDLKKKLNIKTRKRAESVVGGSNQQACLLSITAREETRATTPLSLFDHYSRVYFNGVMCPTVLTDRRYVAPGLGALAVRPLDGAGSMMGLGTVDW